MTATVSSYFSIKLSYLLTDHMNDKEMRWSITGKTREKRVETHACEETRLGVKLLPGGQITCECQV